MFANIAIHFSLLRLTFLQMWVSVISQVYDEGVQDDNSMIFEPDEEVVGEHFKKD